MGLNHEVTLGGLHFDKEQFGRSPLGPTHEAQTDEQSFHETDWLTDLILLRYAHLWVLVGALWWLDINCGFDATGRRQR